VECDSKNGCTVENSPGSTPQSDLDDEIEYDMDEIEDSVDDWVGLHQQIYFVLIQATGSKRFFYW
jgi:hypothetical protein